MTAHPRNASRAHVWVLTERCGQNGGFKVLVYATNELLKATSKTNDVLYMLANGTK